MRRSRLYLPGAVAVGMLGLLAGCGHYLFAEREPWRHDAEVQCLNSGAVKEGPGKVRISPIEGPGICGTDFPFRVSSLGGEEAPLGYGDEMRPPGAIPGQAQTQPRWPITPARPPVTQDDPVARLLNDQPLSLDPPRSEPAATGEPYDFRKPYGALGAPNGQTKAGASASAPHDFSPQPYDRREVVGKPATRPVASPVTAATGPVAVSPSATLACPLVAALDQWVDEAVQPAALKWFGVPVVEIKQISAYSCRGMNGDPNATISEHAFGNALDIAAFTLADGRKIDVQHGWHGAPEEQAFLHDVQASACNQFSTVLAPGYNIYHYNHIHVDLMRRRSDHRACEPQPVSGEQIATRLGLHVSARTIDPVVTGSIAQHRVATAPRLPAKPAQASAYSERRSDRDLPDAVPGADGEDER